MGKMSAVVEPETGRALSALVAERQAQQQVAASADQQEQEKWRAAAQDDVAHFRAEWDKLAQHLGPAQPRPADLIELDRTFSPMFLPVLDQLLGVAATTRRTIQSRVAALTALHERLATMNVAELMAVPGQLAKDPEDLARVMAEIAALPARREELWKPLERAIQILYGHKKAAR